MTQLKRKSKSHRRKGRAAAQIAVTLCLVLMLSVYFGLLASAQNTTYTITDGDDVTLHSSASTDIQQVLAEAGITVGAEDLVTVETVGSTTQIQIQRSQEVTVSDGGQAISASTYETTVEKLLASLNITLSQEDTMVSQGKPLSMGDMVYDGMSIDITRSSAKTRTETVSIPYDTVTYLDPTLEIGTKLVKTAGVEGQQEITYRQEFVNGSLVETSTVGTKLLSAPVTEVILVGSGEQVFTEEETAVEIYTEPEAPAAPAEEPETDTDSSYDEPESDEPESSYEEDDYDEPDDEYDYDSDYDEPDYEDDYDYSYDEPEYDDYDYDEPSYSGNTITTSTGEVLSYIDVLSVEATAYCGGGTTATGTPARYGAIAVDPRVIPYGTRMYIVSDDGKWIYGVATAEDCGGAIKGNIIDLYFDSYDTCIQFGRRNCTVYILEWG